MATAGNPNLRVRISADLEDIKKGLGMLRGELARVKKDAQDSMPDMRPFQDGLRRARTLLGGLFAGVSAGALVRGIVGETGQAQSELAQLRAALKSTQEAAGLAEGDLVSMAQNFARATTHSTGEIIDAQTRLLSYSGIAANEFPRALQLAIDQSVRLGQSLVDSAERIGTALEYPAQGVASLTRQGFRFSAEQRKLLREMERTNRLAEAQALVMEVMEESYRGAAEAARRTLPGALTALRNAFKDLLDGQGGANAVVEAINNLTDALRSEAVQEAFRSMATSILQSTAAFAQWMAQNGVAYLRLMAEAVAFLVRNLDMLVVALLSLGVGRVIVAIRTATAGMTALAGVTTLTTAAVTRLRAVLTTLGGPITLAIAALSAGVYYLYQRTTEATRAAEEHSRVMERVRSMSKFSAQAAREEAVAKMQQARASIAASQAVLAEVAARRAERASQPVVGGRMGDMRSGEDAADRARSRQAESRLREAQRQADELASFLVGLAVDQSIELNELVDDTAAATGATIARSNALLRDAIARQLREVERLYDDHEIGLTEYFTRREALQRRALDAELEQVRMTMAATEQGDQRRKLEEQLVILERDRAEIATTTARERLKAEEDLQESIEQVYIARLEGENRVAAAVRARLEAEFKDRKAALAAEGRTLELEAIELHISTEVAKAQLDQFAEEYSRVSASLRAEETAIAAQMEAGLLGQVEGERRMRELRAEALRQLVDLRAATVEYLATLDPESGEAAKARQFLRGIETDLANLVRAQQKFRRDMEDLAERSLGDFFYDLATGASSFKDAFQDMVRSFAQGIARIIADMLAMQAVRAMAGAFGGGIQLHGGGTVGSGSGHRRQINPLLIGAAPRYHTGGTVGLAPNETVAVLEYGERVRTKEQERALQAQLGAGRRGGDRVAQPIVAFGDKAVADALAGAAGRDVVLTHVRNAWEDLQNGG